jgi:hypothetical protein
VLNERGEVKGLENHPLVQYILDVFPKELPSLPPKRELEFTIDLKPRTEPIMRMPY